MESQDKLIHEIEATLDEAKSRVALLANRVVAKVDSSAEVTKHKAAEVISDIESRREAAEQRLKSLREASGHASNDMIVGVKKALQDLKTAVNSANSRLF